MALLTVLVACLAAVLAGTAQAWSWPTSGVVLRPFAFGDDPYAAGLHRGVDVAGEHGETVVAPVQGRIAFAGTVPGSGRTVTIETADGFSVTLVHLGTIAVARGRAVVEGAAVGAVGDAGPEWARPYVHLGVRITADPHGYVDPLRFLPPRSSPGLPDDSAERPADAGRPADEPTAGGNGSSVGDVDELPDGEASTDGGGRPTTGEPEGRADGADDADEADELPTASDPPTADQDARSELAGSRAENGRRGARRPARTVATPPPRGAPPFPRPPVAVAVASPKQAVTPAPGAAAATAGPAGSAGARSVEVVDVAGAPAVTSLGEPEASHTAGGATTALPGQSGDGAVVPTSPASAEGVVEDRSDDASPAVPSRLSPGDSLGREPGSRTVASGREIHRRSNHRDRHSTAAGPAEAASAADGARRLSSPAAHEHTVIGKVASDRGVAPSAANAGEHAGASTRRADTAASAGRRHVRSHGEARPAARTRAWTPGAGAAGVALAVALLAASAAAGGRRRVALAGDAASDGAAKTARPEPWATTFAEPCSARRRGHARPRPCARAASDDPLAALLAPPRRRPAPQSPFRGRSGRALAAAHATRSRAVVR